MLGTSVTGTNPRRRDSTDRSATAASPPVYTIGSSASERDRLRSQTDELHEHSVALLERVGIQPGGRVLELHADRAASSSCSPSTSGQRAR